MPVTSAGAKAGQLMGSLQWGLQATDVRIVCSSCEALAALAMQHQLFAHSSGRGHLISCLQHHELGAGWSSACLSWCLQSSASSPGTWRLHACSLHALGFLLDSEVHALGPAASVLQNPG